MKRSLITATSEVEKESAEGAAAVSEISDPRRIQPLDAGFSTARASSAADGALPYHKLGGPGLERLCYSLISARGGVPRYFGDSGQEQYGIDLIVSDGAGCTVS